MGHLWRGLALSKVITSVCEGKASWGFSKNFCYQLAKNNIYILLWMLCIYLMNVHFSLSFPSTILFIILFGLGEDTYRGFNLVFFEALTAWEDSVYTKHP